MANNIVPSKIKKVKGTYRADRAVKNEMEPIPLHKVPKPPESLKGIGLEEWNRVCKNLLALGMLNDIDLSMLAAYCSEISMYSLFIVEAQKNPIIELKTREGTLKAKKENPFFKMAHEALDKAHAIAVQFGFTPASRTKINMPSKADKTPLEQLKEKYKR